MRHLLAFVLMIALVGSAAAADLGSQFKDTKSNNQAPMNPGTPDGREGGETMADAFVITALPFDDTGNTSDNVHDYDAVCNYTGSTAPDVVYSYTPAADEYVNVDLCGSGYDTKTYIMDGDMNIVACNDDFYTDAVCGTYVSFIEGAGLGAGITYYIVVDGYGTASGDYVLNITTFDPPEPCVLDCMGVAEGEPDLAPGYADVWNSGCNDDSGVQPFQEIVENVFCGVSGWNSASEGIRDTDWFIVTVPEDGILVWTLDAEQETYGFLLSPQDCDNVAVAEQMTAGPCAPATMEIQGNPGDLVWLWVGPTTFDQPAGVTSNMYNYQCNLNIVNATEDISFDGIKSLYR